MVVGLLALAVVVPWATAGAQAPPTTAAPGPAIAVEVDCGEGIAVTPTHGPPGTEVTVTATFTQYCTTAVTDFTGAECTGRVTGPDVDFTFPMAPTSTVINHVTFQQSTGTFTAPVVEPYPPVVDATEDLTVTVSCTQDLTPVSPPAEGGGQPPPSSSVVYGWDARTFTLDLFAQIDEPDPPTDPDVAPDGVVSGSPSFTG
jgi:hypothetical protein